MRFTLGLLALLFPGIALAQPLGGGGSSIGNSAASPLYTSTTQNGAGTNILNVGPAPQTGTWTYSGTGSTVLIGPIDMTLGGYNSVALSIQAVASGTMNFQASNDPTADTWVNAPCARMSDNTPGYVVQSSAGFVTSFSCSTGGLRYFRAFVSGWTTGTLNGFYNASQSQPLITITSSAFSATKTTPSTGTWTVAGATVGTTSAQVLAAGTYNHVTLQNVSATSTVVVGCAWGTTAVLNASNTFLLNANAAPTTFGPPTSGVSAAALNCISSAVSTPLYVERN